MAVITKYVSDKREAWRDIGARTQPVVNTLKVVAFNDGASAFHAPNTPRLSVAVIEVSCESRGFDVFKAASSR